VKNSRREVATTRTVETGAEMLMTDNIGIQQGDPEKNDIGVAIGTSTPNRKPRGSPANLTWQNRLRLATVRNLQFLVPPPSSPPALALSQVRPTTRQYTDPHLLKLQLTLRPAIRPKLLSPLWQILLYPHPCLPKILRLSVCLALPHRRLRLRPSKLPTWRRLGSCRSRQGG